MGTTTFHKYLQYPQAITNKEGQLLTQTHTHTPTVQPITDHSCSMVADVDKHCGHAVW